MCALDKVRIRGEVLVKRANRQSSVACEKTVTGVRIVASSWSDRRLRKFEITCLLACRYEYPQHAASEIVRADASCVFIVDTIERQSVLFSSDSIFRLSKVEKYFSGFVRADTFSETGAVTSFRAERGTRAKTTAGQRRKNDGLEIPGLSI